MPEKTETDGPESLEKGFKGEIPVSIWDKHAEFECDGLAGGNYNPEVVKLVFYADKPVLAADGVRTVRVQIATMSLRRSRFRQMIQHMTKFADHVDAADKQNSAKASAEAARAQGTPNASS